VADPSVASTPVASASISPLLFVAGGSVAVVVFCLLLLASRPQPRLPPQLSPPPSPGHPG
jgi:hypothetical protein